MSIVMNETNHVFYNKSPEMKQKYFQEGMV